MMIKMKGGRGQRKSWIFVRFVKQKLELEVVNYKPTFGMLKMVYRWSRDYELQRVRVWEVIGEI